MKKRVYMYLLVIWMLCFAGCVKDAEKNEIEDLKEAQIKIEQEEVLERETEQGIILEPIEDRIYGIGMAFRPYHYEMLLTDDATYKIIKDAYNKVDFCSKFEKGNEESYDKYLNIYLQLIYNERPFVYRGTREEYYMKDFHALQNSDGNYLPEKNDFFLFDIDGDGEQELYVRTLLGETYIFKYLEEKEQIVVWYAKEDSPYYSVMGTQTVCWTDDGLNYGFYRLDKEGNEEIQVHFYEMEDINPETEKIETVYMVSLPEYADSSKAVMMTKGLQQQSYYNGVRYFFRVTKKQYEELTNDFFESQKGIRECEEAVKIDISLKS